MDESHHERAQAGSRRPSPDATIGPWAANLITHSTNQRLPQDLELVARYRPPIVITALGSPKPAIELVHGYGGIVIADVVNLTLAKKAIDAGADGLACVSAGAGGHTGFISPFAFISAARELTDGLVIVGGGIADGQRRGRCDRRRRGPGLHGYALHRDARESALSRTTSRWSSMRPSTTCSSAPRSPERRPRG